jgi:hypothetical protein
MGGHHLSRRCRLNAELLEAGRVGRRVSDDVLDVAVPEIILNEPCIRVLVGQGEATSVSLRAVRPCTLLLLVALQNAQLFIGAIQAQAGPGQIARLQLPASVVRASVQAAQGGLDLRSKLLVRTAEIGLDGSPEAGRCLRLLLRLNQSLSQLLIFRVVGLIQTCATICRLLLPGQLRL